MVFQDFQDSYCGSCINLIKNGFCKSCEINNLKDDFANWTSENEKVDNFIQEMQLKINSHYDTIVEWIPYNQFDDIKKIGKGGFATVYSATWIDGPLTYKYSIKERKRTPNETVALKCLNNSQSITIEFLNEV